MKAILTSLCTFMSITLLMWAAAQPMMSVATPAPAVAITAPPPAPRTVTRPVMTGQTTMAMATQTVQTLAVE